VVIWGITVSLGLELKEINQITQVPLGSSFN
jgi:hypothetical protein